MAEPVGYSTQISAHTTPRISAILFFLSWQSHRYHIPGSESSYVLANRGNSIPYALMVLGLVCDALLAKEMCRSTWNRGGVKSYETFLALKRRHRTEDNPVCFPSSGYGMNRWLKLWQTYWYHEGKQPKATVICVANFSDLSINFVEVIFSFYQLVLTGF